MAEARLFHPAPSLDPILAQIGSPRPSPFRPDPFQKEALEGVAEADILVCAPTGAGKTWIALEAMDQRVRRGERCWYASPLKALSNAKYEEFRERFGPSCVGILTGDRKENPEAPVIVGTTEILRNQLYDAMEQGRDLAVDLVVVDEAHYLSDPDRGVVWEEVLIYLPVRVRLLLLSATVGNPREICQWLEAIRGHPCHLVQSTERPVPLHPLFVDEEGCVSLLVGRRGLQQAVLRHLHQQADRRGRPRPFWYLEQVVDGLRGLNLLPAILFLKSRADCDRAVASFAWAPRSTSDQEEILDALEPILQEHPVLRGHRQLRALVQHGVASHHAGQLPQWKLLVEQLMNQGYLDAIFSTSTVAAGVDFPARTVVVFQSDRYTGRGFEALTATALQQMTGRAGRRGKDRVGFALFVPGAHQDLARMGRLLRSPPEGLRSQIQTNFSMVLNLLLSHHPQEIRQLLGRSLAAFQQEGMGEASGDEGGVREAVRTREEDRSRVGRSRGRGIHASLLLQRLGRGRLFLHKDGAVHMAFYLAERRGKPLCMAHRLDRKPKIRKGRLVLKGVPLPQIEALLEKRVALPEEMDVEGINQILKALRNGDLVDKGLPGAADREVRAPRIPPRPEGTNRDARGGEALLWRSFLHHLEFLKETGFVDETDRLTSDGRWASRLRLDHPILVAECIRGGVFEERSAPVLAGLIAPFVTDREREVHVLGMGLEEMGDAFDAMVTSTRTLVHAMEAWGFPTPLLQLWPAAVLYLWAKGLSWRELNKAVAQDEGDLVSLIVRTADHLRQVCDLAGTHPRLAGTARMALRRIQREPAIYL